MKKSRITIFPIILLLVLAGLLFNHVYVTNAKENNKEALQLDLPAYQTANLIQNGAFNGGSSAGWNINNNTMIVTNINGNSVLRANVNPGVNSTIFNIAATDFYVPFDDARITISGNWSDCSHNRIRMIVYKSDGQGGWINNIDFNLGDREVAPSSFSISTNYDRGGGLYTLRIAAWDGKGLESSCSGGSNTWVDNLVITASSEELVNPLLESMIWSGQPECPFCTSSSAVGQSYGINTNNGNATHLESLHSIPVNGGSLDFNLNNSSQRTISQQTAAQAVQREQMDGVQLVSAPTTDVQFDPFALPASSTASLPAGWVHNYAIQLILDDAETQLDDTIELQTPGGSLLPFYVVNSQAITNFVPYAGVTAALTQTVSGDYVMTGYNQSVYTFDNAGKLQQQEDATGNTITFSYHTSGNGIGQLYRASQGSRFLEYQYNANGQLETILDNIGRPVTLGYDVNGRLETLTNPEGETKTYSYTTEDLLTSISDQTGRTLKTVMYNEAGQAYEVRNGAGEIMTSVGISTTDSLTRTVIQNGVEMLHTYDSRGTLVNSEYACDDGTAGCNNGGTTAYDYNFKPGATEDANGNSTSMRWSEGGSNLESVTNALDQNTSMVYDDLNNLTQITNDLGQTTVMTYGNSAHPTFMTEMEDNLGQVTLYIPTASGQLAAMQGIDGVVTSYQYDSFGQTTEMRVGAGSSSEIVTFYGYDGVGRLITTTQHSPNGAFDDITNLTVYDDANRVEATIQNWLGSDPANWAADCDRTLGERDYNVCTTMVYDDAGRITQATNPIGQTSLSFYDAAGRSYLSIQNYTNPNGYGYDTDLNNDGLLDDPATTIAAYCVFNDLASPDSNICSVTEYDGVGRVIASRDALGRVNRTEYDSLGRVAGSIGNSVNVTSLAQCQFPPAENDEDLCSLNEYDANGNLILTTDSAGRQTRLFYDALNRVEGTVSNHTGLITSIADFPTCFGLPTGRDADLCSQTAFDDVGNAILATDPAGRQTRIFYDGINRVELTVANWNAATFDVNDYDTSCGFDLNNIREENICSRPGYDDKGRQVTSENALGQTSLTVYDQIGRPFLSVTNWDKVTPITSEADCSFPPVNPDQNLCSVVYFDDLGRQTASKDPLGNMSDVAFDDLGRTTSSSRYLDGGVTPVTSSTAYDALGRRLSSTDPDSYTMSYGYDGVNRTNTTISHEGVSRTTNYNPIGWVTSVTDGLNHTSSSDYDALGRLIGVTNAEGDFTEYLYDVLGNQTAIIDANGIQTSYQYDELNRLFGVVENDTGGPQNVETDQDLFTEYEYNILGSRTTITNARGFTVTLTLFDDLQRPITVTDSLGNSETTVYDALGNVRQFTDRNGELISYDYDQLNRPTAITYHSDGEVVEMAYDALGNRRVMTDSVGTTSYSYDDLYRVTSVNDVYSQTVGYGYDLRGNRTLLTYPDGRSVTYRYDGDGRLYEVEDWNNAITSYEYDMASRLITTTLPNGVQAVNGYDDANRLTSLVYTGNDDELVASFIYGLDGIGNRTAVTETLRLPGVAQETTAFLEQNGELILEAESGNDSTGTTHSWVEATTQSGFGGDGYVRSLPDVGQRYTPSELGSSPTLNFDVNVTTAGDYTLWVRGMASDQGSDSLHVSLDGVHQAAVTGFGRDWSWSKIDLSGTDAQVSLDSGLHDLTLQMREDGLRVDAVIATDDPAFVPAGLAPTASPTGTVQADTANLSNHVVSYGYDDLYRLTNAIYTGDVNASYVYDYDQVGNMEAYTETVDNVTKAVTRVFNANNQLTSEVTDGTLVKDFYYDNNGNLVQENALTTAIPVKLYDFNQRNLMIRYSENVTQTLTKAEFVYDGNKDRVAQSAWDNGLKMTETRYTNDTSGLTQVLVFDDGTLETYMLYGQTMLGEQIAGSSQFMTHITDGLGSVRAEMETSGASYVRTFSPFGETLTEHGMSDSAYGYTGQQEDENTGLLYLRARYYNPKTKFFNAYDVWQGVNKRPQSLNHYAYVEGNPIGFIDPTGYWRWRSAGSFYHDIVENWYESDGRDIFISGNINPNKQLEYYIPPTLKRPDMFNSISGDVYEIEPVTSALVPGHGVAQAQEYVALLNKARTDQKLTNTHFTNPQVPYTYNWNNNAIFHLGTGTDWPGKLRATLNQYPQLDFVADYVTPGLVLYWFEFKAHIPVPARSRYPEKVKDLIREKNWNPRIALQPAPVYTSGSESINYPQVDIYNDLVKPLSVEISHMEAVSRDPFTVGWFQKIWEEICGDE